MTVFSVCISLEKLGYAGLRPKFNRASFITLDRIVLAIDREDNEVVFPRILHRHARQLLVQSLPITIDGPCNHNWELRGMELICKPYGREDRAFKFADVISFTRDSENEWDVANLRFVSGAVRLTTTYSRNVKWVPYQVEYFLSISKPKCNSLATKENTAKKRLRRKVQTK